MDFVTFVLCVSVIAKTSAAPLGASIPHHNNEFDLPEIARKGFELKLNATIDKKFEEKLKHQQLVIILEPSADYSDICGTNAAEGMHICILPQDKTLIEKHGNKPERDVFDVRITATPEPGNEEELNIDIYIKGNYATGEKISFEKSKHVSVRGVIGTIQQLHFDFSESN